MAYPNRAVQVNYDRYQSLGMPGAVAKNDNNTFYYDVAEAGVDLLPGDGVYIETAAGVTQGEWVKGSGATSTENLVTHVVGFDATALNIPIVQTGNANSQVQYPADTPAVKAMANGSVYVVAGATILRGQELQFSGTAPGAEDSVIPAILTDLKLLVVALSDAQLDDVFPVRITRIA